ncbi:MAG TPA: hypothetical protein VFH27_12935, partial [Longimicrobiaceae bacterium]|nr:hypothetical protein [Longimicrobiaceae bacterium]
KVVDLAEAWTLRGSEGKTFAAVVIGARNGGLEVQMQEPPIRAEARKPAGGAHLDLGAQVTVRLVSVDTAEGRTEFEVVGDGGGTGPRANMPAG